MSQSSAPALTYATLTQSLLLGRDSRDGCDHHQRRLQLLDLPHEILANITGHLIDEDVQRFENFQSAQTFVPLLRLPTPPLFSTALARVNKLFFTLATPHVSRNLQRMRERGALFTVSICTYEFQIYAPWMIRCLDETWIDQWHAWFGSCQKPI